MDNLRDSIEPALRSISEWVFGLGVGDRSLISLRETMSYAKETPEYAIHVHTGTVDGAGTDADVFLTIFGAWRVLPETPLDNGENNFEKGKADLFTLKSAHLGPLQQIRIRHGNNGVLGSAWYLQSIVIHKLGTSQRWEFPCRRWLSKNYTDNFDCAIDLLIPVGGPARPNPDVQHRCTGTSQQQPATPPATEPTVPTASKLLLYNCHTDRRSVHVWVYDFTAGTREERTTLSHHYDSTGSCPAAGIEPFELELQEGHVYQVVAVDPGNVGCGLNDPEVVACQRWSMVCKGDSKASEAILGIV